MRPPFRLHQPHPDPIPISLESDREDLQIARINDLTRAGRANWFGLLAYLAFTMITLLAVEDVDFFLDSRQTDLPLIGVSIPTRAFFYAAPILGAALHVYLHLFVRKCTAALMAPTDNSHKGELLETHILPWLLNDLVLRWRGAAQPRPLDGLSTVTAVLLIWVAGPLVLGFAWVRSWPAHDQWITGICAACFSVAIYATFLSGIQAVRDIRHSKVWKQRYDWWALVPGLLLWGTILLHGEMRALGGLDLLHLTPFTQKTIASYFPEGTFPDWALGLNPIKSAFLGEAILTPLPDDWLPYQTHKRRFRIEWCAREGLDPETCGPPYFSDTPPVPHLTTLRQAWCNDDKRQADCDSFFTDLDRRFATAWTTERATKRGTLPRWAPTRKDLRGAELNNATLTAADLRFAQMEGADLSEAQMEGADLFGAQMEGAVLFGARMEGANLSAARMEGANWAGLTTDSVPAQFADFRGGVSLDQARLSSLIGNAATLLPDDPDLYVCTCWAQEPASWSVLVDNLARPPYGQSEEQARAAYICPAGQRPQKTGTPWPADHPPPWGDFPPWSPEAKTWAAAQPTRGDCPMP